MGYNRADIKELKKRKREKETYIKQTKNTIPIYIYIYVFCSLTDRPTYKKTSPLSKIASEKFTFPLINIYQTERHFEL